MDIAEAKAVATKRPVGETRIRDEELNGFCTITALGGETAGPAPHRRPKHRPKALNLAEKG